MSRRTTMKCMRRVCSTSKSRTVRPRRSAMRKARSRRRPGVAVVRASSRVRPPALAASPRTACGAMAPVSAMPCGPAVAGARPGGCTSAALPTRAAAPKAAASRPAKARRRSWTLMRPPWYWRMGSSLFLVAHSIHPGGIRANGMIHPGGMRQGTANPLGEDLHRAAVVRPQRGLDRHVEVAQRLEVVRERERADVDRAQPAAGGELLDGALALLVVAGDEDVERLARHRAVHQRAGEGRVERLDHLRGRRRGGD